MRALIISLSACGSPTLAPFDAPSPTTPDAGLDGASVPDDAPTDAAEPTPGPPGCTMIVTLGPTLTRVDSAYRCFPRGAQTLAAIFVLIGDDGIAALDQTVRCGDGVSLRVAHAANAEPTSALATMTDPATSASIGCEVFIQAAP